MTRLALSIVCALCAMGCSTNFPTTSPSDATRASEGPVETKAPIEAMFAPTVIYVTDFQALAKTASADGPPRLLPGVLHSARSQVSQAQFCGRLSSSIVSELRRRGFAAEHSQGGALPATGWLLQGAFVEEQSSSGGIIGQRFAPSSIEMFVRVQDLDRGAPKSLGEFTVGGERSGEGLPFIPNPYAAAAKFVVRQSELSGDAATLAKRVADEVVRFARSEYVKPSGR